MFLPSNDSIRSAIKDLMANDPLGPTKFAVAFWGSSAERVPEGECWIICDLFSGACNPSTIRALRERQSCLVFRLDKLHAKVVVNNAGAIVSSANMSNNGLGREGAENVGTFEAGYRVAAGTQSLKDIHAWFDQMWERAEPITEDDLRRAQLIYDAKNSFVPPELPPEEPTQQGRFAPIAAGQLLKESIDPENRVRAVQEFVLGIANEVLQGLGRGAQGKIATFACHAILCRSGAELFYSRSGNDPGGPITEAWIASRFYMNGKDTRTRVDAVLRAMTAKTVLPVQVRRVAAEVLATPAWVHL